MPPIQPGSAEASPLFPDGVSPGTLSPSSSRATATPLPRGATTPDAASPRRGAAIPDFASPDSELLFDPDEEPPEDDPYYGG
jgi:hypothetical protein